MSLQYVIWQKAIEDGAEQVVGEDDGLFVFKAFSYITENRVTPEVGYYLSSVEAKTIHEAREKFKKEGLSNIHIQR